MLMYVIPRHAKIMQHAMIILTSSTSLPAHAQQDIQENCVKQVKLLTTDFRQVVKRTCGPLFTVI
jgi:hypothetical protein